MIDLTKIYENREYIKAFLEVILDTLEKQKFSKDYITNDLKYFINNNIKQINKVISFSEKDILTMSSREIQKRFQKRFSEFMNLLIALDVQPNESIGVAINEFEFKVREIHLPKLWKYLEALTTCVFDTDSYMYLLEVTSQCLDILKDIEIDIKEIDLIISMGGQQCI